MPATVITICNQKGGTGKTVTAINLARAAVRRGLRALLVDLDPQGNATTVTTAEDLPDDALGVADALSSRTPDTMADVIVPGVWDSLDVAPTVGATLGAVRDELIATAIGRERTLSVALAPIRDRYDVVIIDCAPSLDQLTINALTAADAAVAVTEAKLFGTRGLVQLLDAIKAVTAFYNPELIFAAVIVNRYQAQTVSGRAWKADLDENRDARQLPILDPPMPFHVAISDAAEAARGLDEWPTPEARSAAELYGTYLDKILATTTEGKQS